MDKLKKGKLKKISDSKIIDTGKRGLLQILFGRTMIIIALLAVQVLYILLLMFTLSKNFHYYYLGGVYIFTAAVLIMLLNTDLDPTVKFSWSILIAVLPAFGGLLYLFCHYELGHRLGRQITQSSIRESRQYMPRQKELLEEVKQKDPYLYSIARYLHVHSESALCRNSQVKYFPTGQAKFRELLQQLEKAEHFIFLEYFIIDTGYMWNEILEILARKAAQGVDVRVMYDGTCAVARLPYTYPKKLRALGIKCKMFAPLRPLVSTHYNNRDHRKILVIDGHTAFTGGINLADEYINYTHPYGQWKDTAVMVTGEAARGFTRLFLQLWNAGEKNREYKPFLLDRFDHPVDAPGYVIPFGDSPMDSERVGEMVYVNILNQAQRYVYIMTPYLILDNVTLTALKLAAKRGVDVRLILPHIPDKKYAFVLAKSHYAELSEAGVKIYEFTPGFVHAKVFLSDNKIAVVGTINLDYRSLYHHYECAAVLYRVPAIKDIWTDFRDTFAQCQLVTKNDIRHMGFFTRLFGAILKVIAPLM